MRLLPTIPVFEKRKASFPWKKITYLLDVLVAR
jgi:hypothetical protein